MKSERETERIIIIGTNGTGKSTISKKLVLNEIKKPDGHAIIVTQHLNEWTNLEDVNRRFIDKRVGEYAKARRLIFQKGDLQYLEQSFRNGLLLFEDCRMYLHSATDEELHSMLIASRQRSVDIVAVGHGFTEVPPKFFTFSTKIILFKTRDNIKMRKPVLLNFEEMQETQLRINQRADDTSKAWTASGKIADNKHYYEIIKL